MTRDRTHNEPAERGESEFGSTRWSVVIAAGQLGDGKESSADANEALAVLCRDYWYPLYAYVRRRVHNVHEAQDLIQAFFTRLLEKNVIGVADPERGRFRAFLLTALRNFLANEWEKAKAEKRGGGRAALSLDLDVGESRFIAEPADTMTAERLFERRWAETLLDRTTARLRDEFVRAGKEPHFNHLKVFLTGRNESVSYGESARQLGLTEGAVMVAAHRMRRRFRDLLRAEIAQTVAQDAADPDAIEDEIRSLFHALGPG